MSPSAEDRSADSLSERELFGAIYRRMRVLAGAAAPDLDDLVQIAAEQVFKSLGSYDGRSDLATWVYSICYRVLLHHRNWYRRWQLRFRAWSDADEHVPSSAPSVSAQLEAAEQAHELRQAIARMSDKYRVVVMLHDIEELSVRQIAAIVGANELTVRSRLRDGRQQLGRLLRPDLALEPRREPA